MHDLFAGRRFAAFLFDMDGTLTDSIAAANRVWTRWSLSHGLDPGKVLPIIHGVRAGDTIRRLNVPGMDVEKETEIVKQAEIDDVEGVVAIKGAATFLEALPPDRWAVVTSAPRELALRRFAAAALPMPRVLVSAEDVTRGKPAPDGFLLAARLLDVAADRCVVFEDTAAGVAAAEAAGAAVVVVNATHATPIAASHPVINGYERLSATSDRSDPLTLAIEVSCRMDLCDDPEFFELLTGSYARLVGSPLVASGRGAEWLYHDAPFAVVAHNSEADPRFIYANKAAQDCFGYTWAEFTALPSRLSAEVAEQAERQRLLEAVTRNGFMSGYRGMRIAKSGRRFWIEDGVVWQLLDAEGVSRGQAATFSLPR